jgi:hypothetical protein
MRRPPAASIVRAASRRRALLAGPTLCQAGSSEIGRGQEVTAPFSVFFLRTARTNSANGRARDQGETSNTFAGQLTSQIGWRAVHPARRTSVSDASQRRGQASAATAWSRRRRKEAALRPPLAPLPRRRLRGRRFAGGRSEADGESASRASARQESHLMQAEDAELEQFRREVNCAALLEGWAPSWRLDRKESTRRALIPPRGGRDPDRQP